jgi:benzoyl-CoA reductase/2-hydroxyglutaryl-CoA dehydratase subunit BcrC/BadD/HgdB
LHGLRYIDFDEEKPKDASHSLALSLHRSMAQSLRARTAIIIEICKSLHIDGIIARFHVGCRTVAGDPLLIKESVTKELGIPVLLLEWESFDPRAYNEEQFRRQFELFRSAMANNK